MEKPPRPRKELRSGFSTGTAAAAAAQGALWELLELACPEMVEVPLPGGGSLTIPLHYHRRRGVQGEAAVIKDAGDDPDVTNGAEIGARVWRLDDAGAREEIVFQGGAGVGRVTKPGLVLAVGEPAINPVPRQDDPPQPRPGVGAGLPWPTPAAGRGNLCPPGRGTGPPHPEPAAGDRGRHLDLGHHRPGEALFARRPTGPPSWPACRWPRPWGSEADRLHHRGQERVASAGATAGTAGRGLCADGRLRPLCPEDRRQPALCARSPWRPFSARP